MSWWSMKKLHVSNVHLRKLVEKLKCMKKKNLPQFVKRKGSD